MQSSVVENHELNPNRTSAPIRETAKLAQSVQISTSNHESMLLSSSKEANQMFKTMDKVRASDDVNSVKTESLEEDDLSGDGVVTRPGKQV